MFSNTIICKKVASFLTLEDYPGCTCVCKSFQGFASFILNQEALYFGGDEQNALAYLKGLCSLIKLKSFPLRTLSLYSTLLKIRSITIRECFAIINHDSFIQLLPVIRLSREIGFMTPEGSAVFVAVKELCIAYADYEESLPFIEVAHLTQQSIRKINHLQALIQLLIEKGAKDVISNTHPRSAFEFSLSKSEFRAAKHLKDQGINYVNYPFNLNDTYLHMAMRHKQDWMLEGIDNFDALVNAQNDEGSTSLHLAMQQKFLPGILFLLSNAADLSLKDKQGKTPIDYYPIFTIRKIS